MCEYCKGNKKIQQEKQDVMYFIIDGKHLQFIGRYPQIHSYFGRDVIINYCPMCGRKLGE